MNPIKLLILQTLVILMSSPASFSQPSYTHQPYIINYSKIEYKGGTENWKILVSKDGHVYAANNEGLMVFNGKNWKKYPLPNFTILRSLAIDTSTGRIYVGGQDEIGYFEKDAFGKLVFQSLKNKMPDGFKSFEDVWEMQIGTKGLYFRTMQQAFVFQGDQIQQIHAENQKINFIKLLGDSLILGVPTRGVLVSHHGKTTFLAGSEIFKGQRISDALTSKGNILFVTEKNGMYSYDNTSFKVFLKDKSLARYILTSILSVNDQVFAVSSVLNGILFFDKDGKYLYAITKNQGLQNNNIISLARDHNGNIWAGSTNGIDQVLSQSPYSIMYPDLNLEGSVYAVKIMNQTLYAGTNNGLFFTRWVGTRNQHHFPSSFKKVHQSEGQVWALDEVGGDLFMCHNEGLFQIVNDQAVKISEDYTGTWDCISLDDGNKMIVGTYNGFQLYYKTAGKWKFSRHVTGFTESARVLAMDDSGHIWVSHPYRGVYRLTFSQDYQKIVETKLFGQKDGLGSDLTNYVTSLLGTIYVNGEKGIFQYQKDKDCFAEDVELSRLINTGGVKVRRLFDSQINHIWFVSDVNSGFLEVNNQVTSRFVYRYLTPFLDGKWIGGFEHVYARDSKEVFVCTNKGLILVELDKFFQKDSIILRFNTIHSIRGDTQEVLFEGLTEKPFEKQSFLHNHNNLFFSFGSNHLDPSTPLQFSTILEGLEKEWSEYSYLSERTFYGLKPGKYTLRIKALSGDGRASSELSYPFSIQPPWYLTKPAVGIFIITFLSVIWLLIKFLDKKHEGEKIQLKQNIVLSEAKVESLLDEKLQAEIEFKNKELALSTMHIVQKNEVLGKIRQELDHVIALTREQNTKSNIRKIVNLLSDDERLEEDWESFARHFDQVHTDFLRRLKEKFPQLSNKDLKLCAYLRMNLTTKDIAPLLNISVRGVEISRYRLRKKMNIHPEINLNDFMMQF